MSSERGPATMRQHPGTWVLGLVAASALGLVAAGQGWVVSLVLLALILAVPLARAADAAKRILRIPRAVVVFLIPLGLVLLVLASLTMGGIQIGNAIAANVERGQGAAAAITNIIYRDWMSGLVARETLEGTVAAWLKGAHRVLGLLVGQVITGLSGAVTALGVLLVSALIALRPRPYYDVLVGLFPAAARPRLEPVLAEVGRRLWRWVGARVISAAALSLMTAVGLLIAGTKWAVGLGLITGLFSFVPVVGTVLAGLLAFLTVIVTQQGSWVLVLVVFVAANAVETYVLLPALLSRAAHIPPGLTIGSLLVMGAVGGLPGLLIASPLVLVITTVGEVGRDAEEGR